ncbi:RNA polymerase sigma factor [Jatrophihabitans fulvus]
MTSADDADGPHDVADAADGPGLLDRVRAGDQAAFAELYRDVQPRLRRYATVLIGADAEDVTSEAWLQIARDVRGFAGDLDAFRGWAAKIVRNRALDLARYRSRRPADATPLEDLLRMEQPGPVAGADAAELALERISTERALELIAQLPRDQAEAVLLRAVVGLDSATAGEVLGKSATAVRVSAHRGLKRLGRTLRAQT